jgi:hypothetical protein
MIIFIELLFKINSKTNIIMFNYFLYFNFSELNLIFKLLNENIVVTIKVNL